MDAKTTQKILEIQEAILTDKPYQTLYGEYVTKEQRFSQFMQELPEEQRQILEDYLGVSIELHLRMLELACADRKRGSG